VRLDAVPSVGLFLDVAAFILFNFFYHLYGEPCFLFFFKVLLQVAGLNLCEEHSSRAILSLRRERALMSHGGALQQGTAPCRSAAARLKSRYRRVTLSRLLLTRKAGDVCCHRKE